MSLKVVTALKARQIFGTIMNAVSFRNDQYIVERKGMPMVAIIPIKKFRQMDKARQRFFSNMSKSVILLPENIQKSSTKF